MSGSEFTDSCAKKVSPRFVGFLNRYIAAVVNKTPRQQTEIAIYYNIPKKSCLFLGDRNLQARQRVTVVAIILNYSSSALTPSALYQGEKPSVLFPSSHFLPFTGG